MQRHYALRTLLTAIIVTATTVGGFMTFKVAALPFEIDFVNAHSAVINPIKGISMPAGIRAGDRLNLAAQPLPTRIAISINTLGADILLSSLPLGHTYEFVIERNQNQITVPVAAVSLSHASGIPTFQWITFIQFVGIALLALLAVWRGHDRAAAGMALWTVGLSVASFGTVQFDGVAGLMLLLGANVAVLFARIGFYVMADAIARAILSSNTRRAYLGAFVLILGAGAVLFSLGGPVIFTFTGWAGGVLPRSGLVWSASYLVPIVLLFSSYQHATQVQRLRLRWMLWSSVLFLVGIVASNTLIINAQITVALTAGGQVLGMAGFLYAVLRHRVVDVSVFLDRTLVYGSMTALVVGVLAAVNSLVEHAALGTNASLLLQVAVPLALGIVLMRVRAYLDRIVERVFFRKKYLADKTLRRFASICGQFEQADELMATAIEEIRRHLAARGIAFYERRPDKYICARQEGDVRYPSQVKIDDTAFVAARADQTDIDLAELHSSLGNDGYVFPMSAHGEMQHVLVCANRPGEHYAADERLLLAHVAREMGMALYALRMQAKAKVVDALVNAPATSLREVQAQARMLLNAVITG